MSTAYTKTMLQEARTAYHNLVIGRAPSVIVDQNGERVEFNRANQAKLAQYIQQMEIALNGCAQGAPSNIGPANFIF